MIHDKFPGEFTVRWGRKERIELWAGVVMFAACLGCGPAYYLANFRYDPNSDQPLVIGLVLLLAILVMASVGIACLVSLASWSSGQAERIRSEVAALDFDANADGINPIVGELLSAGVMPAYGESAVNVPVVRFTEPVVERQRSLRWLFGERRAVRARLEERVRNEAGFDRRRFDVAAGVWAAWRHSIGKRVVRPGRQLTLSCEGAALLTARAVGVRV